MEFRYPEGASDAETLFVHPVSSELYVIVKERGLEPTLVYKTKFVVQPDTAVVQQG